MTRLDMGLPPPPPVARYPSRPQQQPIDYNTWTGADYGGGMGIPVDYPLGGFDNDEPLTPPPKKVVSEWINQSHELTNRAKFNGEKMLTKFRSSRYFRNYCKNVTIKNLDEIQSAHSGCSLGIVDIKTKVPF